MSYKSLDILCAFCASLFDSRANWHHETHRLVEPPADFNLQNSANGGCHMCALVLQATWTNLLQCRSISFALVDDQIQSMFYSITLAKERGPRLEVDLESIHGENRIVNIYFEKVEDLEVVHKRPKLDPDTGSEASLEQVKSWLSASTVDPHFTRVPLASRPCRLIEIDADIQFVRLIEGDAFPDAICYMSLSYCWGLEPFMKLTSNTIDLFRSGIEISRLPQTFRDAAKVTRFLGVSYLWIDALCILQDSEEDWSREAPRMNLIYQHSFLNLANCASERCIDGMFRRRQPCACLPCYISPTWTCFEDTSLLVAYPNEPPGHWRALSFFRRGWTLQETFFAPRTVYFGPDQILFEDNVGMRSECQPFVIDPAMLNEFRTRVQEMERRKEKTDHDSTTLSEHRRLWEKVVEDYSQRELTYGRDKLVALAGVAKYMSTLSEGRLGRYLAGLWENDIETQLAWTVPHNAIQIRPSHLTPTWSWASVNVTPHRIYGIGGLSINKDEIAVDAEFVNAKIYGNPDEFGIIESASLELVAPILEIAIAPGWIMTSTKQIPRLEFRGIEPDAFYIWETFWDSLDDLLDDTWAKAEDALSETSAIVLCRRLGIEIPAVPEKSTETNSQGIIQNSNQNDLPPQGFSNEGLNLADVRTEIGPSYCHSREDTAAGTQDTYNTRAYKICLLLLQHRHQPFASGSSIVAKALILERVDGRCCRYRRKGLLTFYRWDYFAELLPDFETATCVNNHCSCSPVGSKLRVELV